jgi:transcription elongation factor SPT5
MEQSVISRLLQDVTDAHLEQESTSPIAGPSSAPRRNILSALCRPSLPGRVYVECRSKRAVYEACSKIPDVHLAKDIVLVPLEDRVGLLTLATEDTTIPKRSWVRVKRGLYKGDEAFVIKSSRNSDRLTIVLVPRMAPWYRKGKRRSLAQRPPPQLFYEADAEAIQRVDEDKGQRKPQIKYIRYGPFKDGFEFKGRTYFNGFLFLNVFGGQFAQQARVSSKTLATFFLNRIITTEEASSYSPTVGIEVGNAVKVVEGAQAGLTGIAYEIIGDAVRVKLDVLDDNGDDVNIDSADVPVAFLKRVFKVGSNVRVVHGAESGRHGIVVAVYDALLTFVEDKTLTEVRFDCDESYLEFN